MAQTTTESSTDGSQKSKITNWLREADLLIRSGRYLVADDLLQEVLRLDPKNDSARSFQDRIQFLIKQLSQRPNLSKELQEEVKKYSELMVKRRVNKSSSLVELAQKFLEDGDLKQSSDYIARALALDPGNAYAKALMHRLGELQKKHSGSPQDPDNVFKYRSFIWETWHKGQPSEAQLGILKSMQRALSITDEAAVQIEKEVRNRLYRDSLAEIWRSGGISAFTEPAIEDLRKNLGVTKADHLNVEAALLKEMPKARVRGTVLVVEEDEGSLLEITQKLRAQSFAVIAAASVEEALSSLKKASPDIVLSEMHFRAKPLGLELFEFIRTTPGTRHAAFLFMAPTFERTTLIIGRRLGVDEFILKPIDYEMLVGTLIGKLLREGSQMPSAQHIPARIKGQLLR
jgi:CheY-like chemotaxis protein